MKVESLTIGLIGTNCYFVIDETTKDCLLIDCAYSHNKLNAHIEKHGYNLLAILLTHGHFDHCGGVSEVVKDKNIPVYCQVDDVEIASNASKNRWHAPAFDCMVTNPITQEKTIKLGNFDVGVMFTPGHTPGSVCYFIGDYMFSGDTLFCGDIGRTDLDGGNYDTIIKSLSRIFRIQRDYIVKPGHDEETTLSQEHIHNPYFNDTI